MKIGQLVNKIPVHKLNKETTKLIDSTTLLGVEVEVENYLKPLDIHKVESGYWTVKEDNSLRNNGMEMVFAEPLCGIDAVKAVEWLFDQAREKNWNISKLCGAHVHMDVRGMEISEFKNFCAVYSITEPLIYNWVGDDRHENMFCLPWYMADAEINVISKVLRQGEQTPKTAKAFLESLSKYSGLNIGAVSKFGTAEFRMLKTTFNKARFIAWLNIILSLKKYAMTPGLTPEIMVQHLTTYGPYNFAMSVFGGDLATAMWYEDYIKDCISLGLVTCEWFLDNIKDLSLKGKPAGAQLDWARVQKLSDVIKNTAGEHKGFAKWSKKVLTTQDSIPDPKAKRKKSFQEYADELGISPAGNILYSSVNLPSQAMYHANPSPPPGFISIEESDDLGSTEET